MQQTLEQYQTITPKDVKTWVRVGRVHDFPEDGGVCVKHGTKQIAVFNFARRMAWYACQNLCPHKLEMVLSRGLTGDLDNEPKVACPLHKKTFSLKSGKNLNGDDLKIATYPVKIERENVYIGFSD
ncbi:nitrite reductase small subunit NirD [Sinomicrobium weinanense]|uniref:Nitrite reductase small subunit NirD n=1 Tax=Sinomicrobium weinanense TaxID=2842200 RepID=A0A926Q1C5_9FLAO|nr:nitrite reductase small subunit NirD [Sinomicrobium weinanense]MBC9795533.1 nitrite reductase small subunit NirD [Sinomicrobium weinanense]MBU3123320.1 nitrite reductase small subunit NirD [Sinomicrobium weinanense]